MDEATVNVPAKLPCFRSNQRIPTKIEWLGQQRSSTMQKIICQQQSPTDHPNVATLNFRTWDVMGYDLTVVCPVEHLSEQLPPQ